MPYALPIINNLKMAAAPLAPALALRQVAAPKASAAEMVRNSKNIYFVKTFMNRRSGGLSPGIQTA